MLLYLCVQSVHAVLRAVGGVVAPRMCCQQHFAGCNSACALLLSPVMHACTLKRGDCRSVTMHGGPLVSYAHMHSECTYTLLGMLHPQAHCFLSAFVERWIGVMIIALAPSSNDWHKVTTCLHCFAAQWMCLAPGCSQL